jgi:hypothetical protein
MATKAELPPRSCGFTAGAALELSAVGAPLYLIHSPVAAWLTWGLGVGIALIYIGHGLIGLLEHWDRYRANRPKVRP